MTLGECLAPGGNGANGLSLARRRQRAPLNSETRTEFAAGDGDEFGTADEVGKIHSLQVSGPSPFD